MAKIVLSIIQRSTVYLAKLWKTQWILIIMICNDDSPLAATHKILLNYAAGHCVGKGETVTPYRPHTQTHTHTLWTQTNYGAFTHSFKWRFHWHNTIAHAIEYTRKCPGYFRIICSCCTAHIRLKHKLYAACISRAYIHTSVDRYEWHTAIYWCYNIFVCICAYCGVKTITSDWNGNLISSQMAEQYRGMSRYMEYLFDSRLCNIHACHTDWCEQTRDHGF